MSIIPPPAGQALCAETDPDLFFPGPQQSAAYAKRICRSCEIRVSCLGYALDTGQEHGIWGGFGDRARDWVAAQVRAGRSLEDVIAADDEQYYQRLEKAA